MRLRILLTAGMATVGMLLFAAPAAHAVTCPNANPVVDENNCHGPGDPTWKLNNYGVGGVSGFATQTSVDLGSPVALKMVVGGDSFPVTTVDLKIYRMGYYGGAGARLVHSANNVPVNNNQGCQTNATTGWASCSNWPVTYTIPGASLPASGVYIVKSTVTASSNASYIGTDNQMIFTVRDDARSSKLLYQLPISTYEAYNNWGGKSLYTSSSFPPDTVTGTSRAAKVSFDRPFANVQSSFDWFPKADYPLLYWLERNGYDVTYTDDVADHANPAELLDHEAVVISGHDEYWSGEQLANFKAARAAGVNIANFGSNTAYWKIRYEDGNRSVVSYKTVQGTGASGALGVNDPGPDGVAGTTDDALGIDGQAGTSDDNPQNSTTTFRDNGAPPGDLNAPTGGRVGPDEPENSLFGVMYVGDNDSVNYQLRVPAANGANEFAGDSIWRHAPGISPGSATTLPTKAVGWEWDAIPNAGNAPYSQYATRQPAGVKRLTETDTTAGGTIWLQDEGRLYGGSPTTGQAGTTTAVRYTAGSGAQVFSAATEQWSWGLGPHGRDDPASLTETYQDPLVDSNNVNIKQATYNLLADMSVEPKTAESGITLDHPEEPSFTGTSPASPSSNNNPRILGTAGAGMTVKLYTNGTCTGAPVATDTAANFASPGIQVAVANNSNTTYHATATDTFGSVSACSTETVNYVEDSIAPVAPSSLSSTPISPSNDNNPLLKGNAEAGSTVTVFTTHTPSNCSGSPVATGSAATFNSTGIPVPVPSNAQTTMRVKATDAAGNTSPCSSGSLVYTEDSNAPAEPSLNSTSPASPAFNNNPRIIGTLAGGEPASTTVKLYPTSNCSGPVAAQGDPSSFTGAGLQVTVASNSNTTFHGTATDAAGNTSNCSASAITYVEDSILPDPPVIAGTTPASPANNNNPSITGTAEAGSTVNVYASGACSGTAVATGSAASFGGAGLPLTVTDNSHNVYRVTATDAAGNSTCAVESFTYDEDSAAPSVPTVTGTTPASPANDNAPKVIGTLAGPPEPASTTVKIYNGLDCTGSVVASGSAPDFISSGITSPVTNNTTNAFRATATDAAGNTSGCSAASFPYVEDSAPPALPSALATNPTSPANNNAPHVTGTAELGSTVNLYATSDCSGTALATGSAANFNSPGFTVAPGDDTTTTFHATATDVAGNTSGCSTASTTYVEDSTKPDQPTLSGTTPVSPANNNAPKVSGDAELGSTVKVYANAGCTGSPLVTGTAADFSSPGLTVAVLDNTNTTFHATATDQAGNISDCSTSTAAYTEDSAPPAAPTLTGTTPTSPANDNNPKVSGNAEAGSNVKIYNGVDCTGTVVASGSAATFASPGITSPVTDNTNNTFRATATDAAGNTSSCALVTASYTEDSTPPALPSALATNPASPANDNAPHVTGTAAAGSTVNLYSSSDCSGTALATGSAASFNSPGFTVAPGDNTTTTFHATATDVAGNTSGCSTASTTYVEDSTDPAPPTLTGTNPASPSNDNTPQVTGNAESGSTVKLYTDSNCTGAVAATGSQASFNSTGLTATVGADSSTTFHATATDQAGNTSACSSSTATYVEDSTDPAQPTLSGTTPTSPANNNNPRVLGSAEAGSTVNLYPTSDCSGTAAATGSAANFNSPGLQVAVTNDTSNTYHATTTDQAGNTSSCSSSSTTYVEDSTPPAQPTLSGTSPVSPANDNSPKVLGTAAAGSTVKIYSNASCTGSALATGTAANFNSPGLTVSVSNNTTTTFRATATDAAGNPSTCSSSTTVYQEDSTIPQAPTFTGTTPNSPATDTNPRIRGNADANTTVKLYANSTCTGSPAATGSDTSFNSPGLQVTVPADTTTTFHAAATNGASTASACSPTSITYTSDSTPPNPPTLTGTTPASPSNVNNPFVKGSAESNSTVKLYATSDCSGPAEATGSQSSFASTGLQVSVPSDQDTTFHATATDQAGNVSDCSSSSTTYTEDETPPAEPTLDATIPTPPANDNAPRVKGSAPAGTTVKLYATSDCSGAPAASGSAANFSSPGIQVTVASDQSTTFRATATDAAGNESTCSSSTVTYDEDSTAPAPPTLSGTTPGSPANNNSPRILGSAESSSTVKLYKTPGCTGSAAATGTDAELASPGLAASVPDDSTTTFHATATDQAGNTSPCSPSAMTYVEDTPNTGVVTPDKTVEVAFTGSGTQRALKKKAILVSAVCPKESCQADVSGFISVGKASASKQYTLKRITQKLTRGQRVELKLKLSKSLMKRIKKALKSKTRKNVRAIITVTVTDAAKNKSTKSLSIKIKK